MIRLMSFGYLHAAAPTAGRVVDVRESLHDPAAVRGLLDLAGMDPRVATAVLATPGATDLVAELVQAVADGDVTSVAIGCAGGRHRSVALIEETARRLAGLGVHAEVQHLHIHLPRVRRGVKP